MPATTEANIDDEYSRDIRWCFFSGAGALLIDSEPGSWVNFVPAHAFSYL